MSESNKKVVRVKRKLTKKDLKGASTEDMMHELIERINYSQCINLRDISDKLLLEELENRLNSPMYKKRVILSDLGGAENTITGYRNDTIINELKVRLSLRLCHYV